MENVDRREVEMLLSTSIKYNSLIDFLLGKRGCYVRENPRDPNSPHAFYKFMLVYNDINSKYPALNLSTRFLYELQNKMSQKHLFSETYLVFKAILAQLNVEKNGKASFNVDKEELENLLNQLKNEVEQNKEIFSRLKCDEGEYYKDGVYGYIYDANENYYKQTGHKIL